MVRFGVIGTGWIVEEFIRSARESEEFVLTAMYSRTEERAKQFAAKFDIPHTFTNLQSMAESDELDAIYIASPNSLHAGHSILFMNHGKHVLCEKPLASNANEVREMIAAAKENSVLFMEALKTTFVPNFAAIRDNLHKLGPIHRYFTNFSMYTAEYETYKQGTVHNTFNPDLSTGSLMDLGIYCIYPMVVLFGRADLVRANAVMLDGKIDGAGSLLLKHGNVEGVLTHSKIADSNLISEIQGENGTMILGNISKLNRIEIRYRDGSIEDITQPQPFPTMYYETKQFTNLLKNGKLESIVNSYENSLFAMEIMDEAREQIGLVFPADKKD